MAIAELHHAPDGPRPCRRRSNCPVGGGIASARWKRVGKGKGGFGQRCSQWLASGHQQGIVDCARPRGQALSTKTHFLSRDRVSTSISRRCASRGRRKWSTVDCRSIPHDVRFWCGKVRDYEVGNAVSKARGAIRSRETLMQQVR